MVKEESKRNSIRIFDIRVAVADTSSGDIILLRTLCEIYVCRIGVVDNFETPDNGVTVKEVLVTTCGGRQVSSGPCRVQRRFNLQHVKNFPGGSVETNETAATASDRPPNPITWFETACYLKIPKTDNDVVSFANHAITTPQTSSESVGRSSIPISGHQIRWLTPSRLFQLMSCDLTVAKDGPRFIASLIFPD